MSNPNTIFGVNTQPKKKIVSEALLEASELATLLTDWFGFPFEIWDSQASPPLQSSGVGFGPGAAVLQHSSWLAGQGASTACDILSLSEQVGLFLVPLEALEAPHKFGVARVLLSEGSGVGGSWIEAEAKALGVEVEELRTWALEQERWSYRQLTQSYAGFQRWAQQLQANTKTFLIVDELSEKIAVTYEEITLIYSLTEQLKLTSSDVEIARLCMEGALECIPAEGIAIQFLPSADCNKANFDVRSSTELFVAGDFPLDSDRLASLIKILNVDKNQHPVIVNQPVTSGRGWPYPEVHQIVIVPLREGENNFGYLTIVNHNDQGEFGSVEAHLLGSIATILGIHLGNLEHYRQQKELLANVVRTLTTAIEVKDPYTCGHSERVARVAVLLAKELGCDSSQLQRIFMGGLLHDVGKIGIDDAVLRKPGRLTEEEFDHIRLHPTLGYNILCDVKQFDELLPIVLYHHEQIDGGGYPRGLRGEEIPLLARITAVADAYDAMTSDRPYRAGMQHEKVKEIFIKGYAQQWDAGVLDAFLRIEDQILAAVSEGRRQLPLNVSKWISES